MLCKNGVKKNQVSENQTLDSCICRDYWSIFSRLMDCKSLIIRWLFCLIWLEITGFQRFFCTPF